MTDKEILIWLIMNEGRCFASGHNGFSPVICARRECPLFACGCSESTEDTLLVAYDLFKKWYGTEVELMEALL